VDLPEVQKIPPKPERRSCGSAAVSKTRGPIGGQPRAERSTGGNNQLPVAAPTSPAGAQ